jgi:hypothetical protein
VVLAASSVGAAESTFTVARCVELPLIARLPAPAHWPTVSVVSADSPPVKGPTVTEPVLVRVPATVSAEPPTPV